ncbi:hypothetical protein LYNGBM3L_31690 [Moorena producens 3L]|uniref:Uncharacterized protein n=1 Tax=Moorena producens 3L TaxID=489825 RepID=F4XU18_9CYAN|nr:hypothetical protein LYNGBM3L_31690 [Moorena producens 3L]OLT66491.1 hypothetical protein BI334_17040 [Moorena producens 3L]
MANPSWPICQEIPILHIDGFFLPLTKGSTRLGYKSKHSAISGQLSANQRQLVNKVMGWYRWFKIPARFANLTPCSERAC